MPPLRRAAAPGADRRGAEPAEWPGHLRLTVVLGAAWGLPLARPCVQPCSANTQRAPDATVWEPPSGPSGTHHDH
jgi:hypothetical protein